MQLEESDWIYWQQEIMCYSFFFSWFSDVRNKLSLFISFNITMDSLNENLQSFCLLFSLVYSSFIKHFKRLNKLTLNTNSIRLESVLQFVCIRCMSAAWRWRWGPAYGTPTTLSPLSRSGAKRKDLHSPSLTHHYYHIPLCNYSSPLYNTVKIYI